MRAKVHIIYLTLLVFTLPYQSKGNGVKFNLNKITTIVDHAHSEQLMTSIHHYEFPENKADGKNLIVIDAGHGGHDPGTSGKHSKEKDIALQIALKLGKEIQENSTIEVRYTRTKDVFLPLHKRIGIANKAKADLFISIHCNYVDNPHVCGTETFVMGLHRAEDNLETAKRENSVVLLENEYETHYEGYDPNSPVGHILLSMYQNLFIENSISLASEIETSLTKRKETHKSRGVKQAGFVVLRKATMPSVLVETGFLSNPKEEAYLMSELGQFEMANSIASGVKSYFKIHEPIVQTKPSQKEEIYQDPQNYYAIQAGVFSQQKDEKYTAGLLNYGPLEIEKTNTVYKYLVGKFANKTDAKVVCDQMKIDGFSDVFIKHISKR